MSGCDKAGKGLGKGSAKYHHKVLCNNIQGITMLAICCLDCCGGMKLISGVIYKETHRVLNIFLNVSHNAIPYMEYANRRTVTAKNIYMLKC
ncbi:hypothetical protein Y1Q_0008127 [Alligator mississippiensis]|uniref:Histone H4 n=1 Tax=Alligator mississippiensis TaxID=8496 RepID=A0A151P628_ALLMI|nr:hypothetical protein Y1Q_0008127 [Alligator mississippiensis]